METIDIVIETPKGSAQKYNYDPQSNFFRLSKILPAGMVFPFDFGFIPNTRGEDGDPLDIMIISEFQSFPGCMITCRIIGGIKAKQTEKEKTGKIRNDRFIAVPVASLLFQKILDVKDLPDKMIGELQDFFVFYNKIRGVIFTPIAVLNSKSALKLIKLTNTGEL